MCTYKTKWEASKNNSNSGSRSRDHLGRSSLSDTLRNVHFSPSPKRRMWRCRKWAVCKGSEEVWMISHQEPYDECQILKSWEHQFSKNAASKHLWKMTRSAQCIAILIISSGLKKSLLARRYDSEKWSGARLRNCTFSRLDRGISCYVRAEKAEERSMLWRVWFTQMRRLRRSLGVFSRSPISREETFSVRSRIRIHLIARSFVRLLDDNRRYICTL